MQIPSAHLRKLLAGIGFIAVATFAQAQMTGPNAMRDATKTPAIPEEAQVFSLSPRYCGFARGVRRVAQLTRTAELALLGVDEIACSHLTPGATAKLQRHYR